ncbi:hypothetical protein CR513_27348, partial [Mucuna pruriens]
MTSISSNSTQKLGHEYSKTHNNLKILDSLPNVWEPKSTIIQETCDIKTLTLDQIIGALRVYKVHLLKKTR